MTNEQTDGLVKVLRIALGPRLLGAYLYGSAVVGGLRPASDLDLFALTDRRTTAAQRRRLIDGLRPMSARYARPAAWRPVELTIAAQPDIVPWRYPPPVDFQSGEWLRANFDAAEERPWRTPNPDLAIVITQVRGSAEPLFGPPAAQLLPDVPRPDLRRAMTDELDNLVNDLPTDTVNVLLTLARIWTTLDTGRIVPKDVAADWAIARLAPDESAVLERARETYRAGTYESWDVPSSATSVTAAALLRSIERSARPE